MQVPQQLLYSEDHIWVQVEGKQARIGMTEFAESELGEIVFVELPKVGDQLNIGDAFGSIESVKTVSELSTPLTGVVVASNKELENTPGLVNSSPYEAGWMITLELSEPAELDKLWKAEKYIEVFA